MSTSYHPEQLGDLYHAGHAVVADSKLFVDAVPLMPPEEIRQEYESVSDQPGFDLRGYIDSRFSMGSSVSSDADPAYLGTTPAGHIDNTWELLTRFNPEDRGTLIGMEHPYITPSMGPYFEEQYYWDTLFTNLGLNVSGRHQLARGQIMNIADMIGRDGYMRNGNRTYLDRTQHPVFALMVEDLASREGDQVYWEFLPALLQEDAFFRQGEEQLEQYAQTAGIVAVNRMVRMPGGEILDRPYSDSATPRPERYADDVKTAALDTTRPPGQIFRDIRAGAENARDYGSAVTKDGLNLHSIHTTELATVERNSFRFMQEKIISKALTVAARYADSLDESRDYLRQAQTYAIRAGDRGRAIRKYCWDEERGFLFDYDIAEDRQKDTWHMGPVAALYAGILTPPQASRVGQHLEDEFMRAGGLATSLHSSDHMWDGSPPNYAPGERAVGFALDQYLAFQGLRRYEQHQRAYEVARRWLGMNACVYGNTGQFYENYDVNNLAPGNGGEKPVQSGFAWTNGVDQWLEHQMRLAGMEPVLDGRRQEARVLVG